MMKTSPFTSLLLLFLLFTGSNTCASGLPDKPLLRIESGMHTQMINAIATDSGEKLLATASDDKTVRIWDLPKRRLLRTIRMPQDDARNGQIYALAMSPDGKTVAAGGFLGGPDEGGHSIYLLNPRSGWMKAHLSGLDNVVLALTFSPDGRYLAAGLGEGGIRIYDSYDWHLEFADRHYDAEVYGLDFDRTGRLVTGSDAGVVRLYSSDFKLLKKQVVSGGRKIYSAVFSPDGNGIALGYRDILQVDVISGKTLEQKYRVDTSGLQGGTLGRVTWSTDGSRLYAAGSFSEGGHCPVVCWQKQGHGNRSLLEGAATSTVNSLLPLKKGGLLVGSSRPSWLELSKTGKEVGRIAGPVRDFRGNREGFRVSEDGRSFRFSGLPGRTPLAFSLDTMTMKADGELHSPRTGVPGFKVTDWLNGSSPKINGRGVPLQEWQPCRAVAVAADGRTALFGTELGLLLVNRDRTIRWRKATEGIVWRVNLTADGRLAMAALSDGTVRWYRVRDGRELLAFFGHPDGRRWVLWSPSGYYAASAGGAELMGWLLNHGSNRMPDFFPSSRFRSVFYRPDMVRRLLSTQDVKQALAEADRDKGKQSSAPAQVEKMLPPVVRLLGPGDGRFSSPQVTLRYRLRTPSREPVTMMKVLLDGRPLTRQENLTRRGGEGPWELTVQVPKRDCSLSLIAVNRHTASEPVTVQLSWEGGEKQAGQPFIIKPKLYILAVGVSRYDDPHIRLDFPAKDAHDFVTAFKRQEGVLYREVSVRLLTDEKGSKQQVMEGLDWLEHEVTSNDVSAVYLAGHGVPDRNKDYHFLPRDGNPRKLRATGVPYSVLKEVISNLPGKVLFFVDTCHAGDVMGQRQRPRGVGGVDMIAVANDLAAAENGVVVFASSTGSQFSLEDVRWNNGAFTKALVEGLNGAADYSRDGRITINEMNLFLSERVKRLTDGQQTPTTSIPETVPDFPIAVHLGAP